MFQKTKLLRALPAIILSTLLTVLVIYAWTEPTSSPPSGNVSAPLNIGNIGQDKSGALRIGGIFQTDDAAFLARYGGNVGIGTTTPAQKLTVAGTIESTSGGFKFPDGTTQATAAAGGAVPSGIIAMFDTSCPSGWTRFSMLDGRVPRGAGVYGGTGGSDTHTHGGEYAYGNYPGKLYASPASSWPPYLNVIWCKKN